MNGKQAPDDEAIMHYWIRIYKHKKHINYQLMLNDSFGETFGDLYLYKIERATFHIQYSHRHFQETQLIAAIECFYNLFVEPIIRSLSQKSGR